VTLAAALLAAALFAVMAIAATNVYGQAMPGPSQRIEPTQPLQSIQPQQPLAPLPSPPMTAPGDHPANAPRAPQAQTVSPWPTTPVPPASGSEIELEEQPPADKDLALPPPQYRAPECTTERHLRGEC
jgi:hypothetical protein